MTDSKRRLRLINHVSELHRNFDKGAQKHFASATCGKGCNACCEQLIVITAGEAELIVAKHPSVVARLLPRLIRGAQEVSNLVVRWQASGRDSEADFRAMQQEWWELRRPCLLLDEQGLCSIYPDRPFACREHVVVSEPALCASRAPGAGVTKLHLPKMRKRTDELLMEVDVKEYGQVAKGPLQVLLARIGLVRLRDQGSSDAT